MSTRCRRMLALAKGNESLLFLPKYETTKGLSLEDRNTAIKSKYYTVCIFFLMNVIFQIPFFIQFTVSCY